MSESEDCQQFIPQEQRKLCQKCGKVREDHPLSEENAREIRQATGLFEGGVEEKDEKYAWVPPDCPPDGVDKYFEKFPEEQVPTYTSEGQKYRLKQLLRQLPVQDLLPDASRFTRSQDLGLLQTYITELRRNALRCGIVQEWDSSAPQQCPTCLLVMEPGELVVMSVKDAPAYHPACFVCDKCKQPLADLIHCIDVSGAVYCERHFADKTQKRCHACDELIFDSQYSLAGEKYYHREHLRCFECEEALKDDKGYEKDSELYCGECYQKLFSHDCKKCEKPIDLEDRQVTYEDNYWHFECFTCEDCDALLGDKPFEVHENRFLCVDCYNEKYAPRCEGCGERFDGKLQVLVYEEKMYHLDCFKCCDCKDSINTGCFVPHMGNVYCKSCYTKNFGMRCMKCKYPVADDDGILYQKKPYHKQCFTCNKCNEPIADKPFKNIEGLCYCFKCYGEEFCKKCYACNEPILLGAEDDVLYAHQDYHWHPKCFTCSNCSSSLADKPFAMKDDKPICVACTESEHSMITMEENMTTSK